MATREVGGIIGKELTVRGEIEGREDLLVEGVVEGQVRLAAELIVGEGGTVRATVEGQALTVEGTFDGTAACAEVTLKPGSRTTGTIAGPRVVIEDEAIFDGVLDMETGLQTGEGAHG
jgi:cytoskeletal protein CcmA (bactofilin family)